MKKFFVGCNLDFEEELERELKEVWPFLIDLDGKSHAEALRILEVVPGGILIECPLHLGLQLNYFLKCANRILLRIGEKKIRDFPALFQWFEKQAKDPLLQGAVFNYSVTAKQSRLNNEKRIEEILGEVFKLDKNSKQTLYVRVNDDLCSLSLDTTGELLHMRTDKEVGKAPLRETIAAFCVRRMIQGIGPAELQTISLLDPMCGTGTLLLEARNLYRIKNSRFFSFQELAQTPKLLKSEKLAGNYQAFPKLFARCLGHDIDDSVLKIALGTVPVEDSSAFQFSKQDLSKSGSEVYSDRLWVISNIPYGERIKSELSADEIVELIIEKYQPEKIGLLMTDKQRKSLKLSQVEELGYKIVGENGFSNGGIRVSFVQFFSSTKFHHTPEDDR